LLAGQRPLYVEIESVCLTIPGFGLSITSEIHTGRQLIDELEQAALIGRRSDCSHLGMRQQKSIAVVAKS